MNINEYLSQSNWCIRLKKSKTREAQLIKQTLVVQTPFLPDDASLQQRAWHIINYINSVPECPVCNNSLKFQKSGKYSKYCSQKCTANSPETIARKLQTNIDKYGSEDAYRKAAADRLKNISNKKYGVDNLFQAKEIKDKNKEIMLERYGVNHPAYSEAITNKRKSTMLERYGVEHALQSDISKDKFKNTLMERYGVEHALQSDAIFSTMRSDFLEQYGVSHHMQIPISTKSLELLNDKQWLIQSHHIDRRTLTHIATELGVDKTTVSRYMDTHNIEVKYYGNSMPERELVKYLTDIGLVVDTNVRDVISPFELDIYIPSHKLAIEYCGLFWHSDLRKDRKYHQRKYQECKSKGIRLITIFENEWLENKELIKNKIKYITHQNNTSRVYARKTTVVQVDSATKKDFFNRNHVQGNGPSSINYGLIYVDELVACMGFIKQSDGSFILNRYATTCNVVGGFSKILKKFEIDNDYPEIISFADLRWSEGGLYFATGFTAEDIIPPDYSWCKDKKLWHKFLWRHTTGLKALPNYEPDKSEYANMSSNGYYRIWDCGKIKFVKNKKDA